LPAIIQPRDLYGKPDRIASALDINELKRPDSVARFLITKWQAKPLNGGYFPYALKAKVAGPGTAKKCAVYPQRGS